MAPKPRGGDRERNRALPAPLGALGGVRVGASVISEKQHLSNQHDGKPGAAVTAASEPRCGDVRERCLFRQIQ